MIGGRLRGQSRRGASDSARDAHPPTAAEVDRAREAWEDIRRELDAARAAHAAAEELRADVDPDLAPDVWHRHRAENEAEVVSALREVERLSAVEATLRVRAEALHGALLDGPIADVDALVADVDNEERDLLARLAHIREQRERWQAERDDLAEERDAALSAYLLADDARARWERERSDREQVEWYVRNIRSGTPVPEPSPRIRRKVAQRLGTLATADTVAAPVPYEQTDGARKAGITRLGVGGEPSAPFPR